MKILLIISILLSPILLAADNYELKLYEKIIPVIFTKNTLVVYADENSKITLKNSKIFKLTTDCHKATLLIGQKFLQLDTKCLEKPIFTTSYRSFRYTKNSFGAFYWRKGRPQIKFHLNVVNKFNLYLPNSLLKYAK